MSIPPTHVIQQSLSAVDTPSLFTAAQAMICGELATYLIVIRRGQHNELQLIRWLMVI